MQSNYHNLPLINGVAQKAGGNFEATGSNYRLKNDQVHFQTDISAAYPKEAAVKGRVKLSSLIKSPTSKANDPML